MENASKALLISGGILFALLTLSLVAVMVNNINTMESAKDEAEAVKQLSKFNAQYEVFNKQKLYGTEVITAVNKAADNNFRVQDDIDSPWFVDVEINTNGETFQTKVYREKISAREAKREIIDIDDLPDKTGVSEIAINASTINLIVDGDDFRMNSGMIEFFSQNAKDSERKDDNYKYYIYSALTTFKTRIFTGEVEYNDEGRIDTIRFTIQPE